MKPIKIKVRRMSEQRSRQWGVYVNGKLIEGGFFSHDAAERAAETAMSSIKSLEESSEVQPDVLVNH